VTLPVAAADHPSRVLDTVALDRSVYLKDLAFDAAGRPVILYLTSRDYRPGASSGPFTWSTARWTGTAWTHRVVTTSDHNYDHGSLYVEADGTWRVIAPTDPGPQPWGTGGEMVVWTSRDEGTTWSRTQTLTHGSPRNHSYARKPLHAHPGFYALWADGNPLEPSASRVYFATRDGDVFVLPDRMTDASAAPARVPAPRARPSHRWP